MRQYIFTVSIAVTCAAPLSAGTITDTFTSYTAFGDSLSDNGKLGLPLPYFEGQFSSGPVWTEIIGERFTDAGLSYNNLALGGATAGNDNVFANGSDLDQEYPAPLLPFATFDRQITFFETFAASPLLGSNPLVSILFGANDIFQGGNPIDAANALADGIERLAAIAPKFDDFLVSTLPELGDAPGASGLTVAGAFNAKLSMRLNDIGFPAVNVIELDYGAFSAELAPMLESLGVVNLDAPCLVEPTPTTPGSDCTIIGFDADGPIRDLTIADTYLRIDSVHPSGPVQAALGDFALRTLEDSLVAPVPLPATLPLALLGLAGLGFAGARRRARV